MRHERDAAVVSTLRLAIPLLEYCNDRVFPLLLLWDFPLAPDEGGESVELQQDGPDLLMSEFQQFHGKAVRPHCFRVCHCLHRCGNLLLRGLDPDGTRDWMLRQPLQDVGIEHVGFGLQQRAEESYPSLRIRPLSRSSLPRSSRMHCDLTFFISSSCID